MHTHMLHGKGNSNLVAGTKSVVVHSVAIKHYGLFVVENFAHFQILAC
jgi:hypothetical protein